MVWATCPTPLIHRCQDGGCYVTQCPMCPTTLVSFSLSPSLQRRQHNLPSCPSLVCGGLWEVLEGGQPPQTTAAGGSPPSRSRTKHMSSGVAGVWKEAGEAQRTEIGIRKEPAAA